MTLSPTDRSDADAIEHDVRAYLQERLKTPIDSDLDLFASGTVSSMFAMELVVHLEQTFDVVIAGPDLVMDNFRSVDSMSSLVRRLRNTDGG